MLHQGTKILIFRYVTFRSHSVLNLISYSNLLIMILISGGAVFLGCRKKEQMYSMIPGMSKRQKAYNRI